MDVTLSVKSRFGTNSNRKVMISRLKCNFLPNQEVHYIYEYIICLLILKS